MAATTVTPPVAAPAAAAPPTPAPVSTPAAPSAPATPSTPTETPSSQSLETTLAGKWKEYTAGDGSPESLAAPDAEAPAAAEAEAAPAPPAEGEAAPAAEAAPEGAAPEAAAEAAEDLTQYAVDFDDPVGPKEFNDWLAKPELAAVKDALDAAPEVKNAVFGALRRDAENRELRTIVPTVQAARDAVGGATTLINIDNVFERATDQKGAQGFLNEWVKFSMILDDQGQPTKNDQGQYNLKPQLFQVLDTVFDNKSKVIGDTVSSTGKLSPQFAPIIDGLLKFAASSGDERYQSVAEFLKEITTPSSSAPVEVPAELKSLAESLRAKEAAIDQREQTASRQREQEARVANHESTGRSLERVDKTVSALLKDSFAKAGLSDAEVKFAEGNISERISQSLGVMDPATGTWKPGIGNRFFQTRLDDILSRPPSKEREAAVHKHFMEYVQPLLGKAATEEVRSIKGGALKRQEATQTRVAAQQHASREVPSGVSTAPVRPPSAAPGDMRATIEKEYRDANGGSYPPPEHMVAEIAKRTGAFAAKRS